MAYPDLQHQLEQLRVLLESTSTLMTTLLERTEELKELPRAK